MNKFSRIWIIDSSTLEALFCKLKSLEEVPKGQLAGKMATVIDLITRLPLEIWFQENARASDTKLESNILHLVTPKTLLLLDRGFYHFSFWLQLTAYIGCLMSPLMKMPVGYAPGMHQKISVSCAANRVNLLKREPSKLSLAMKRYKAGMDNEFRSENFGSQCPNLNRLIAVAILA